MSLTAPHDSNLLTNEVIDALGELVLLSGNAPFLLQGEGTVWLVEFGAVEIFNVQMEKGEMVGARVHFMSLRKGALFFGMDLETLGGGSGFLAVGAVGTRVRKLTLETLQGLCMQRELAPEIARLVEQWVETVSIAVTRDILPRPISQHQLESTTEEDGAIRLVALKSGGRIKAKKAVVWLEGNDEEYLFLGMSDLQLQGAETFFPLASETWLETHSDTQVRVHDTAHSLQDGRLWKGLVLFHENVCQCEFFNKKLLAVDELNRIRAQTRSSEAAKFLALDELAHVLNAPAGTYEKSFVGDSLIDLTLEVARLVGTHAGIKIKPHPEGKSLAHIASASRFRTRQVALRDAWWHEDQGSMVGTLEETGRPVALIPTSATSYKLVNPENGEVAAINAEVAARLKPFAVYFYRPFPDGPLTAMQLWHFGRRGLGRDFLRIGVIAAAGGMLGTMGPYFTGQIFDWVIPGAHKFHLWQFVLGLAASGLTVATFNVVRGIAVMRMQGKMDGSVQAALMDRLLRLPTSFFRQYTSGDLAVRASGIDAVRNVIAGAGVEAVLSVISASFNLVLMLWYSMKLGVIAIGMILVAVIFTALLNSVQLRYQRALLAVQGKIAGLVFQFVSGVAKLRVSGSEDRAFRVWARHFAEQRRISYKVGTVGNFSDVFNAVFSPITSMVLFWCLVFWLLPMKEAGITPGKFVAFTGAFGIVLQAALSLSATSLSMLAIVPLFERLKPIITAPAEVDEAKTFPGQLSGAITISHVNFRYRPDGPLILKDVNLSIKAGEFIALAGPSGCGKSTMLRLLLGFERPETGSIAYDGQDLEKLDVTAMRHQMGVVLQQSSVMPGDIFRNIVGMHEGTIEEAWEAARAAGMEADIRQMPMEMHTVIGQGGTTFSGGQRQRLMIARAIFGQPRLLFFDEATSALDNRTQQTVTESLDRMQATRIVVAHRLSTIVNADRIIVMDKGQIVQQGTYAELMQQEGPFGELAKRQLA